MAAKTDAERLGVFSEPGYISKGDKYVSQHAKRERRPLRAVAVRFLLGLDSLTRGAQRSTRRRTRRRR